MHSVGAYAPQTPDGRGLDPTAETYPAFKAAYDWFNRELFDSSLRDCLITLQRRQQTKGYFAAERFHARDDDQVTDEIALNPATFRERTDVEILSTLVHEMVHQQQQQYGNPGRGRYHNKEWAALMQAIGLMPSHTGAPGGKQTGERVSHYIMEDGAFAAAAERLRRTGFQLRWQSPEATPGRVSQQKHAYRCPSCALNAWAKQDAWLVCGACGIAMRAPDGSVPGRSLAPDERASREQDLVVARLKAACEALYALENVLPPVGLGGHPLVVPGQVETWRAWWDDMLAVVEARKGEMAQPGNQVRCNRDAGTLEWTGNHDPAWPASYPYIETVLQIAVRPGTDINGAYATETDAPKRQKRRRR